MGMTFLQYIDKLVYEEGMSPENARIEACKEFGIKEEEEEE